LPKKIMNGAESLVRSLIASGVEICFANPGTSEMHFVAAVDRVEGLRPILGLFEGVVSGMADGYARVAGKPAATLLHLGSGLGNAIANLHNARRACSPIVNIVGDHATYHQQWDTPLASDIVSLARSVSGWVHSSASARTIGADAARAVAAATEYPGQVATLILPADTAWGAADGVASAVQGRGPVMVSEATIAHAVNTLASRGRTTVILTRGAVLGRRGLTALGRIAAKTGARLVRDMMAPVVERGAGLVAVERMPYRAEDIVATFTGVSDLLLIGTHPPVTAFAYPNYPSWCLSDETAISYVAHPHEDGVQAVEAIADALGAPAQPAGMALLERPDAPRGLLDQFSIGRTLARHLPEHAVISEEAATNAAGPLASLARAAPHTFLGNTGGAIGQGIPVAAGAAVAAPGRKVVSLQADGSAMYTPQALWTQARERLDVVTVIFANRQYAILQAELARVGAAPAGARALSMLDISNPTIDWVKIAEGLGVEASRATSAEEFESQFADAIARPGPRVIEARL
jgi:acetolactate synthase-1/2/3 large subunit